MERDFEIAILYLKKSLIKHIPKSSKIKCTFDQRPYHRSRFLVLLRPPIFQHGHMTTGIDISDDLEHFLVHSSAVTRDADRPH